MSFSPDGSTVVGGLMNGQVYFYNYEGLKYLTQMNCRNRRGKFKKGTKVTGLSFLKTENEGLSVPRSYPFNTLPPLLVTTNDNRLRLFSLGDFSLRMKYKGVKNTHMQIKASFSDDGKFIVCGSEMGGIVVWETQPTAAASSLSFLFSEQQDRNCSCESILNNSNVPERQPKDKKRIVSSLIGQKNSKRIQSAFRSFATKKDRSRNLNANAGGFANVDLAAATTAAIFAPVSSILHCARSGTPADSPLGSNSASVKSNHPSECSATYAPVKSDALEIGQGQFDCGKQEPGSGVGIGLQNGNQASKIINALNHDGNIVSNGYRGGTGIGADERTGTESANITGTGTKCPPISTADVSRTEAKAGAAGGALRNSRGSRGTANKPAPDPVHQSNIIEVTEGREKEKEKKSQSPASCGTDSRENGEGEDLSSSLRQGQGKEREQSDSIPVPLSDLSSRVIVATDILGYIRVFVRSGKQSVDTKGKMISGMKQMRL